MRLTIYLPTRFQLVLGRMIAALMTPLTRDRSHIANRNLSICFPELSTSQRLELLKKNMNMMGMMFIETAMSWWSRDEVLAKRVRYQGLEHIDAALAKGRGVILLTGHFTSMEIGGRLMMLKFPCYVMFRQLKNPLFNAAMLKARRHHSEGTILQQDPRAMVRALRKNKIVWYAPDQDYGRKLSIFAKFFGQTAATVPATARIAKMSGAQIVLFVPRREPDGSYTLTIKPPLEDFPSGSDLDDTQRINDLIENEIRQLPEQYYWVHRRFKTQPGDDRKGKLYR